MSATAVKLFSQRSRGALQYAGTVDRLRREQAVPANTARTMLVGAFLARVADFENTVLHLFVSQLVDPTSSKVVPRVTVRSHKVARSLLEGSRGYVEVLPYRDRAIPVANKLFRNGYPFAALDEDVLKTLEQVRHVRNALAHHSVEAQTKFRNKVLANRIVSSANNRPDRFLASHVNATTTWYAHFVGELDAVVAQLGSA